MKAPSSAFRFSRKGNPVRLAILVCIGVACIAISFQARNSGWARERRLRALTSEELALAIHDAPRDALTWTYYGRALLKDGKLPEAQRTLERAVQLDSKSADAYLELGNAQARNSEFPLAKQSFQEAVRLRPNEPKYLLALSKLIYLMGSARDTIEPLQKIVAMQPENVNAWHTLGKMYGETHQSDLAYKALKKAVDLDPRQAECWRDLGQVSRHYSRFQEAEEQFKKSLTLNAKDATAHYWLGQMYLEMGDTSALRDQARQQLLETVRLDPTIQQAYFELGRLCERAAQYPEAIAYYQRAGSLDHSDDQSMYHLGLCLIKTGSAAEGKSLVQGAQALASAKHAVEDTENRIRLEPANRQLRLRLARLYRTYDNPEGAMTEYLTYQRMGAQDSVVALEISAYKSELERRDRAAGSSVPAKSKP